MKEGPHFNRRHFLSSSALTSAGALASSFSTAVGAQPKNVSEIRGIELAIATICCDGFANRHHEPSLNLIPQTRFRNVEFNLWYPDTITPRYLNLPEERYRGYLVIEQAWREPKEPRLENLQAAYHRFRNYETTSA